MIASLAAVLIVAVHELGSWLVRTAEALGVEPDGLHTCPDLIPDWVDDGSASW